MFYIIMFTVLAVIGAVLGGIVGWKNMKTKRLVWGYIVIKGSWTNFIAGVLFGTFTGLAVGVGVCIVILAIGDFRHL